MSDPLLVITALAKSAAARTVVKRVSDAVVRLVSEERARREEQAFDVLRDRVAVAYGHLPPGERDAAVVEAMGGSPEAAKRLLEAFADLLDAIDDAAMPLIASLYASYAVGVRTRDRFFRSAGRLLRDASADEIAAIRGVLTSLAPFIDGLSGAPVTRVELVVTHGEGRGSLVGGPVHVTDGTDGVNRFVVAMAPGWETAFALLKDHQLATEPGGGMFLEAESGPHTIVFERRHMDGLRQFIRLLSG